MNKTNPALIVATLAAGSNASPYAVNVNITQQLCQSACVDEIPVFAPSFSVVDIAPSGITSMYNVTIHVEGVISYVPCYCGTCSTRSQIISQDFVVPVYSTTAITNITITQSAPNNGVMKFACCNCSKTFVSDVALSLAIVTA